MEITDGQFSVLKDRLADVIAEFSSETGIFIERAEIVCDRPYTNDDCYTAEYLITVTALSAEIVS